MQLTSQSHAILNNGVEIPRLGLGVYQTGIGETTMRAVKFALKLGYRHIDTAWLYGNEGDVGQSEKVAYEEKRFSLQQRYGIATKDTLLLLQHVKEVCDA